MIEWLFSTQPVAGWALVVLVGSTIYQKLPKPSTIVVDGRTWEYFIKGNNVLMDSKLCRSCRKSKEVRHMLSTLKPLSVDPIQSEIQYLTLLINILLLQLQNKVCHDCGKLLLARPKAAAAITLRHTARNIQGKDL